MSIAKTNGKKPAVAKRSRTSEGLRDILFDEIDELRSGKGDPAKSLAVSHLARQIVLTAKVEIQFQQQLEAMKIDGKEAPTLGNLRLGHG